MKGENHMKKMFMSLVVMLMVVLQAYGAFAACCLPSGVCSIAPSGPCESVLGGFFVNGNCGDPGVCQFDDGKETRAVPTMTQWGMIIFVTLAGLGAIYFIRRNKRTES
jgi:hypothetical protein